MRLVVVSSLWKKAFFNELSQPDQTEINKFVSIKVTLRLITVKSSFFLGFWGLKRIFRREVRNCAVINEAASNLL